MQRIGREKERKKKEKMRDVLHFGREGALFLSVYDWRDCFPQIETWRNV